MRIVHNFSRKEEFLNSSFLELNSQNSMQGITSLTFNCFLIFAEFLRMILNEAEEEVSTE